jgi:hypothetical protein
MCDDVGVDFCYIGLDMVLDDKGFKWEAMELRNELILEHSGSDL